MNIQINLDVENKRALLYHLEAIKTQISGLYPVELEEVIRQGEIDTVNNYGRREVKLIP